MPVSLRPSLFDKMLLTGIVRYVWCRVEQFVNAVATVAPYHRETASLRVFLDDVSQFTIADTRLH